MEELYVPKTLHEAITYFADPDVAHNFIVALRWPGGVVCPFCEGRAFYFIKASRKFHCKGCKKRFSVKAGSIMEDSPLPLDKWLVAMWILTSSKNGVSSCEMARTLGIQQKSAWFLLHRVRYVLGSGSMEKLSGEVEVDETYVGGLEKNKHADKKLNAGRGGVGKQIVLGFREKGGEVRTIPIPDNSGETLKAQVTENVKAGAVLHTDTWKGYNGLDGQYTREKVNHYAKQYVNDAGGTTNGVENVWSVYKRAIKGSYIHVSDPHISRYLAEFDYRFNSRKDKDGERFKKAVAGIEGKRLTYEELTWGHLVNMTPKK